MKMKCSACLFQIAGNKAPQLRHCITCGRPLIPSVKDILEHNCYGLVNEIRGEQIRMATDIEQLLAKDEETLLAEGGTGLGKSYAYTVPALAHYIELANSEIRIQGAFRVVIATANKSLQAQLYSDVPKLCSKLGVTGPVKVVLYKGLNNYACWKLAASVPVHERAAFNTFIGTAAKEGHPADIVDWPGSRPLWWDSVSLENCPLGVNCVNYRDCRPRVKDAEIVITNQHLLSLDLTLFTPGWLFNPYSLLVVDEAHHLARALRSSLSSTLRPEAIAKAARHLLGDPRMQDVILEVGGGRLSATIIGEGIEKAYKAAQQLTQVTARAADSAHRYRAQDFLEQFKDCHSLIDDALVTLLPINDDLMRNHSLLRDMGSGDSTNDLHDHDEGYYVAMINRLARILKPITRAKAFLEKHASPEKIQQYITTSVVSPEEPENSCLYMTPINIGPITGPLLAQIKHKVFVSATLSLNGDFSYFKEDLGLDKTVDRVYLSPFDIAKKVVLYLPPFDMPLPVHGLTPGRLAWISKVADEIRELCNLTRGGVFVLFSAEKDLDEVESLIGHALTADGLKLIVQKGEATQHVNKFRATPHGVLFGLKSIWEGVDIVGDQLRCVIIPKLPFPHPNDPVIASRTELVTAQGDNAFARVSLPAMFTDMRQGTGRLIRSATDKGIVAVLDIRIYTGGGKYHAERLEKVILDSKHRSLGYGKDLMDILGFTSSTNDFTRLGRWYTKTFTTLNTVNTTAEESEDEDGETERE